MLGIQRTAEKYTYEDNEQITGSGFITERAAKMQAGTTATKTQLDAALKAIEKDPSSPTALAKYQAALSEYNLFRNAQSNMVKAYKDIGSAIITNFKN